jgi:hypothetical protein
MILLWIDRLCKPADDCTHKWELCIVQAPMLRPPTSSRCLSRSAGSS